MLSNGLKTLLIISLAFALGAGTSAPAKPRAKGAVVELPKPADKGKVSIEEALWKRRSVRSFTADKLSETELSQLLWSAQGTSEPQRRLRTAPSAGATYPLELYAVTSDGIYRYDCRRHAVELVKDGDYRQSLSDAALGQGCVRQAPVSFVITGVYARTAGKYGKRAERYVHIEVGCAAENLMLEAAALGLGSVAVGAYDDNNVAKVLGVQSDEIPLLIIPVGKPA